MSDGGYVVLRPFESRTRRRMRCAQAGMLTALAAVAASCLGVTPTARELPAEGGNVGLGDAQHVWVTEMVRRGRATVSGESWEDRHGVRYPRVISLSGGDDRDGRSRDEEIQFVLVTPGEVTVDGLHFEQSSPVYMSRDVLSISDAYHGWSFDNWHIEYADFVDMLLDEVKSTNSDIEILDVWSKYISEEKNPYMILSGLTYPSICAGLSGRYRAIVRLPSMAEWYNAMRAGKNSRFWWGDAFEERPGEILPARQREVAEMVRHVRKKNSGVKNPAGFYNMIGNVEQLVYPSDAEREVLRGHFSPGGRGLEAKRESVGEDCKRRSKSAALVGRLMVGPKV